MLTIFSKELGVTLDGIVATDKPAEQSLVRYFPNAGHSALGNVIMSAFDPAD
jgi:hypothetical protein